MESIFRTILKAHQGKTRFNLGLEQILGPNNLLKDFTTLVNLASDV